MNDSVGPRYLAPTSEPIFVIQKHAASHLHYDFRLEHNGVLLSWAVPKGPSLDPRERRLAMHVEDHPIEYGDFEGVIPPKQYGSGTVLLWDRGTWEPQGDPEAGYRQGKLKFVLHGEKLRGGYMLVKSHGGKYDGEKSWLLIKENDEYARCSAELQLSMLQSWQSAAEGAVKASNVTMSFILSPAPGSSRTAKRVWRE